MDSLLLWCRLDLLAGASARWSTGGLPGRNYAWSPDGRTYFVDIRQDRGNLYEPDFEGGSEHPLTDHTGRPGRLGNLWDTDGEFLYFSWREDIGDIWVMDVESDN